MGQHQSASFFKTYRAGLSRPLTIGIACTYLCGVLIVIQLWVLVNILTQLIFKQAAINDLTAPLILFAGIVITRLILSMMGHYAITKAAALGRQAIRAQLYDRIRHHGLSKIIEKGSGALLNDMAEGVESIGRYYEDYLPTKIIMLTIPITLLCVIAGLDWVSAGIMLLTAPIIPLLIIMIGQKAEAKSQRQWHALDRMGNHFLDAVQGLATLKIFNQSKNEIQKIAVVADQFRQDTMSILRIAFLSSFVLEMFTTLSIALIAILIGLRVYDGAMGFHDAFLILLLAPEFYMPLRKMGAANLAKTEAMNAADRIADFMLAGQTANLTADKKPFEDKDISIKFDKVQIAYQDKIILSNVSIDIEKGQHIALVGQSGVGKTSILNILLGFITPAQGEVRINDIPLSKLDLQDWRRHIAWIPQSPTLMAGTIMQNIKMGRQDASDADVYALCKDLCIDDFIRDLPHGYGTIVGERGHGLSGGEIQRIAIARAFLRDALLILMDEPTASLDKETEAMLQHAITSATQHKTVITIAHRLHTVRNADQILVLANGGIQSSGSHDDLLSQCDVYKQMLEQEFLLQLPDGKGAA